MKLLGSTAVIAACMALAAEVAAAPVTLTFEGVGDLNAVGGYYNSLGVAFSNNAFGVTEFRSGGSGRFENEPSAITALFMNGLMGYLNRSDGFVDGLSFAYSSNVAVAAGVAVFDGLNGTGTRLGAFDLLAQASTTTCPSTPGRPPEPFCNWSSVLLQFSGTARSVVFSGFAGPNGTFYDDVSFTTPAAVVTPLPEPGSIPLVLAALGGLVAVSRRRTG